MVDCEILISLVLEKRSLWDIRNKNYHNRDISRKLWNEIASEMQTTSEAVKNKWQNLRDTYRREYMKTLPTGSGAEGPVSKWKYFELLSFLNDTLAPRRVVSNVSHTQTKVYSESTTPQDEISNSESDSNTEYEDVSQVESERTSHSDITTRHVGNASEATEKGICVASFETPNNKTSKKKKRPQKDSMDQLIEIERKKIAHLEGIASQQSTEIQKDEDYFFLMSLLPHLRLIPENRKLQTRIKMQQLVIEEQEVCNRRSDLSTCLPPTPSPAASWTQETNSRESLPVPKASTQDHQHETYQEPHTMRTNDEYSHESLPVPKAPTQDHQHKTYQELHPMRPNDEYKFPALYEFLRFPQDK